MVSVPDLYSGRFLDLKLSEISLSLFQAGEFQSDFSCFCDSAPDLFSGILRSKTIGDFAVFPLCFNWVDFQSDFSCFCGSAPYLRLFSLPSESFVFRFLIVSGV